MDAPLPHRQEQRWVHRTIHSLDSAFHHGIHHGIHLCFHHRLHHFLSLYPYRYLHHLVYHGFHHCFHTITMFVTKYTIIGIVYLKSLFVFLLAVVVIFYAINVNKNVGMTIYPPSVPYIFYNFY